MKKLRKIFEIPIVFLFYSIYPLFKNNTEKKKNTIKMSIKSHTAYSRNFISEI